MDYTALFAFMHSLGYTYFQGKTFESKTTKEKRTSGGIEFFFSTAFNGRGDSISLEILDSGLCNLEILSMNLHEEFADISTNEVYKHLGNLSKL